MPWKRGNCDHGSPIISFLCKGNIFGWDESNEKIFHLFKNIFYGIMCADLRSTKCSCHITGGDCKFSLLSSQPNNKLILILKAE